MNRRLAWKFVCCCSGPFSAAQIAAATGMSCEQSKQFVRYLMNLGRLERNWVGRDGLTHTYRLLDKSPLPAANRRNKRPVALQRVWNSCRMLKVFSEDEVIATSMVSERTASRYIQKLFKARLLRIIQDEELGQLYRVSVDVGASHPEVKVDGVYAPSRQTFYPYREGV
jgi:hypothetical protein